MIGRHETSKKPTDSTYSAQWSGVSYAPHCRNGHCQDCGEQLHHEADTHYCPGCDDFKPAPQGCKRR